jgi:hypothetical protein
MIAACRCGGHTFKVGRSAQSAGICLGSIRKICAIFPLVHVQIPSSS